jgi:hypothetical protein
MIGPGLSGLAATLRLQAARRRALLFKQIELNSRSSPFRKAALNRRSDCARTVQPGL